MKRKDCDHSTRRRRTGSSRAGKVRAGAGVVIVAAFATVAQAGVIRLWPTAVVVQDEIRLGDVCEFLDFPAEVESRLAELVWMSAPSPGGSRILSLHSLRDVVAPANVNLANVMFRGATECAVTRPAELVARDPDGGQGTAAGGRARLAAARTERANGISPAPSGINERTENAQAGTLRQAVIDFLNRELARYGGSAEVTFDHTSEQVLQLSAPAFTFEVRRRGGTPLGLVPLEVDVLAQDRVLQTAALVVQVAMRRSVAIARRPINQDATVRASDVELASLRLSRLDRIGLDDTALVIGQRCRRFISAGTQLEADMFAPVPLVQRGELVTLVSVIGGVSVVTTAKADATGLLGETVKVRGLESKRSEFDAVVVGPGRVQVGEAPDYTEVRYAQGGDRP